jgi:hypothetical protein
MNRFVKMTYVGLLVATCNQFSFAALDSPDGPPPCGQDGVCNLAVCSQDPDCPNGLPDTGSPSGSSTTGLDDVISCNSTEEKDIRAVAWNIADDWTNFDNAIEKQTSFSLGNCAKDRFSKNGRVECMARDNCKKNGSCKQGYSVPTQNRIRVYPDFLKRVASLPQADRRACFGALMTHEFAHSCGETEGRAEAREDAAFSYWTGRFPGTPGLDINNDCGLD